MGKVKSLVQKLAIPLFGISLGSVLIGCDEIFEDYSVEPQQNITQRVPDEPQKTTKTEHEILDQCTQPKIILAENDPRFAELKTCHFYVCSYNDEGVDFNDERWIFHRGERFVVGTAPPRSLYGSEVTLVGLNPKGELIGHNKDKILGGPGNDALQYIFRANKFLDSPDGQGDYKFAWGFNGKAACIQYVRIRE